MSINQGLDAISETASQSGGGGNRTRPDFFKLAPEQTVMVRFLQELDPSHEHYSEEAGLGAAVVEYRHPDDFKKRALDTSSPEDGGKCWMAEQGWKPRRSLYILVQLVDGPEAGQVRILNQGFGKNTISESLIEHARENKTIRDRAFKIKRTGSAWNNTSYTLTPIMKADDPAVTESIVADNADSFVDWREDVLRVIPYEEQEAYFAQGDKEDAASEPTPVSW